RFADEAKPEEGSQFVEHPGWHVSVVHSVPQPTQASRSTRGPRANLNLAWISLAAALCNRGQPDRRSEKRRTVRRQMGSARECRIMIARTFGLFLMAWALIAAPIAAQAQTRPAPFYALPEEGTWVEYEWTFTGKRGEAREGTLRLSCVGRQEAQGVPC